MTNERRRWAAVVLSLMVVGLGHLYAGRPRVAFQNFLLAGAAGLFALTNFVWLPFGRLSLALGVLVPLGWYLWVAFDASRVAAQAPPDFPLRPYNRWYVYLSLILVLSFLSELGLILVRTHLIQSFRMPSPSMEPTIRLGDFFFVTKRPSDRDALTYGSLAVFESPEFAGTHIITRIVGLAGDTLHMQANILYRNRAQVDEPYVIRIKPADDPEDARMRAWQLPYFRGEDTDSYRPTLNNWGPIVVPPDSVFVLGDNRDNSYDSRYYGFVGWNRIDGLPRMIYYSYDRKGVLPLPFLTAVRWNRIGYRFQ